MKRLQVPTLSAMRAVIATLAIAICAASIPTGSAWACSCVRNRTVERIMDTATALFTGVVQESVTVSPGQSITTFRVVEPFKGAATGDVIQVHHRSGSPASCSVRFSAGATYTLAAHRSKTSAGLTTSSCSTMMFRTGNPKSPQLFEQMRALRERR